MHEFVCIRWCIWLFVEACELSFNCSINCFTIWFPPTCSHFERQNCTQQIPKIKAQKLDVCRYPYIRRYGTYSIDWCTIRRYGTCSISTWINIRSIYIYTWYVFHIWLFVTRPYSCMHGWSYIDISANNIFEIYNIQELNDLSIYLNFFNLQYKIINLISFHLMQEGIWVRQHKI